MHDHDASFIDAAPVTGSISGSISGEGGSRDHAVTRCSSARSTPLCISTHLPLCMPDHRQPLERWRPRDLTRAAALAHRHLQQGRGNFLRCKRSTSICASSNRSFMEPEGGNSDGGDDPPAKSQVPRPKLWRAQAVQEYLDHLLIQTCLEIVESGDHLKTCEIHFQLFLPHNVWGRPAKPLFPTFFSEKKRPFFSCPFFQKNAFFRSFLPHNV